MIRLIALVLFLLPAFAQKYGGVLWVEVSKQVAPAGSVVQLEVFLTEPKPIIRTRTRLEFDPRVVEDIESVSIYSASGEATATAARRGNELTITAVSPTGELGWREEYPMFTVNVRIKDDAQPGEISEVKVLPESEFDNLGGRRWTVERYFTGRIEVGGEVSIDRLIPSGGLIKAGQVVRVLGRGFRPDSVVEMPDVEGMRHVLVSENEIHLIAGAEYQLDQREVRVSVPERGEQEKYAAFEGVEHEPSGYDTIFAAVPVFSHRMTDHGDFELPFDTDGENLFGGVALQNPHDEPVLVRLSVAGPEGSDLTQTALWLLPGERMAKDLIEWMPVAGLRAGSLIRVRAGKPIQMAGLAGEHNKGLVSTIPAKPE